jgi:hypothetical protein
MRVALCIFGQPRTFEFCFQSLKRHLLDPYKPDVFLASCYLDDRLREVYKPVAMEIHSIEDEWGLIGNRRYKYGAQVPFPEYPQYPIRPPEDLSLMFKSLKCVEMLKKYEDEHGKYDVVISTRFDAKFLQIQSITIPEPNTLYVPRIDACQNVCDANGLHGGVGYGSHMLWGSSDVMKSVLSSYIWSDECYNELHRWCGELMLKWFCDKHKIKVQHVEVTFMLIRGDSHHPRSHEAGNGYPLSEYNYPQYYFEEETPEEKEEWRKTQVLRERNKKIKRDKRAIRRGKIR